MNFTHTSHAACFRRIALGLALCAALTLSACGSAETDSPVAARQPAPAKKAPRKEKAPADRKPGIAADNASAEYSYDPTGKVDPFLPLIAEVSPRQPADMQIRKVARPLTPLQKFDLKELQLVAVIATRDKASALVQDPSGFGYIVKEGMLIGKHDGILKKIIGNGIIIEEQIVNSLGEPETKISTLTIQHK